MRSDGRHSLMLCGHAVSYTRASRRLRADEPDTRPTNGEEGSTLWLTTTKRRTSRTVRHHSPITLYLVAHLVTFALLALDRFFRLALTALDFGWVINLTRPDLT